MHLTTRNINTAFRELVTLFHTGVIRPGEIGRVPIVRKSSRNGPVIMIEEPVIVTYTHPREKVLFNTARDCNPFSLTYEALWMLAGRNDVASLAYYTKNFANYSDDGKTLNGSYGYRWRHAKEIMHDDGVLSTGYDQLDILVAHLKADPNSRRAVLQMWNVESDLLKIGKIGNRTRCKECSGTGGVTNNPNPTNDDEDNWKKCPVCNGSSWIDEPGSRDVCCNLSVLFSLREKVVEHTSKLKHFGMKEFMPGGECEIPEGSTMTIGTPTKYLDITVINRSNDLVWGLLNANCVTFSILQEYMAARLGVEVGIYNTFTNNLHCYESNWKPEEWLGYYDGMEVEYTAGMVKVSLVKEPEVFEDELPKFVERNSGGESYSPCSWREPFLNDVAQPLCTAFRAHKEKWGGGVDMWVDQIKADDWRTAARGWFDRRKKNVPTDSK